MSLLLGWNPIVSLPANFLTSFPKLKVLNVIHANFHHLPDQFGNLENLVYLDLSYCYMLRNLPDTVRKLYMLKYLMLHDCYELEYLPSRVAVVTSLQVLNTKRL